METTLQSVETRRRRLSIASNFGSRQDLYQNIFRRKQQIIACQLFFDPDDGAPSLSQLREMAQLLGDKFERLRGIPYDLPKSKRGDRVFKDVSDWAAALNVIVQDAPVTPDTKDQARVYLEQVKLKDMTPLQYIHGKEVEVPLWRIYRVGNKSIVLTVDHCIGDGLSLASLLAVVATTASENGGDKKLRLEQVSPLFPVILNMTLWQRLYLKWAFLWPFNFLRCVQYLKKMTSIPTEPITPLMPLNMKEMQQTKELQRIPSNVYGTVYLCPLPVSLFKSIARAKPSVDRATVSDVVVTSVGDTLRRYLQLVGYTNEQENSSIHFGTPLAIPIKSPSKYLDESEGLNSLFVPTMHELPLLTENTVSSSSFSDLLQTMHQGFQMVRQSYVTSLVAAIFRLIGVFSTPDNMAQEMKKGLGNTTFVWSNVPGPTIPIAIQSKRVTELQCLVSNPFCMIQTCSYNGMVYTSIQVDTRTTVHSELLSQANIACMRTACHELLSGAEKENALRTIEEATNSHNPGPFLSPVDV